MKKYKVVCEVEVMADSHSNAFEKAYDEMKKSAETFFRVYEVPDEEPQPEFCYALRRDDVFDDGKPRWMNHRGTWWECKGGIADCCLWKDKAHVEMLKNCSLDCKTAMLETYRTSNKHLVEVEF